MDLVYNTYYSNYAKRPSEVYPLLTHPIVMLWFDNAVYRITRWVFQKKLINDKNGNTVEVFAHSVSDINFQNISRVEKKKTRVRKSLISIPKNIQLKG